MIQNRGNSRCSNTVWEKLRRGFLRGIVIGYTTQRAESSEINQNMCFRESPYGGRVGGWGVFSEFNGIRVRYQEFYGIVTYVLFLPVESKAK